MSFLYTSNEYIKLKTVPLILSPPKFKYLGINLTKYMKKAIKDLHEEKYKTLK